MNWQSIESFFETKVYHGVLRLFIFLFGVLLIALKGYHLLEFDTTSLILYVLCSTFLVIDFKEIKEFILTYSIFKLRIKGISLELSRDVITKFNDVEQNEKSSSPEKYRAEKITALRQSILNLDTWTKNLPLAALKEQKRHEIFKYLYLTLPKQIIETIKNGSGDSKTLFSMHNYTIQDNNVRNLMSDFAFIDNDGNLTQHGYNEIRNYLLIRDNPIIQGMFS